MYGIQYLFDGGLRKFMFRQLEVVKLTCCSKILTIPGFKDDESLKKQSSNIETANSCYKYTCGIAGNQKTNTPRTELGERISCYNNFFIDLLFTAVKFIFKIILVFHLLFVFPMSMVLWCVRNEW
jgi:hypothetical protein